MLSVLFPLRARAFSLAHALALAVHDAVSHLMWLLSAA